MFYLYVVLVMWGGFDTRPSPWVTLQGTFSDQASCTAAASAIAASPAITTPLPMAPAGMGKDIDAFCVPSSTPAGGSSPAIAHTMRRPLQ
jgi:hypothetical protein